MKNNITLSLDREIIDFLKEEKNQSEVVNEQLKAYYAVKECESKEILIQKIAEIKRISKNTNKKRREYEAQLKKLYEKDKKIKKFLKEKNLSKTKLIKQITKRREMEAKSQRKRVIYYNTAEDEAERILKGGKI